MVGGWGVVGVRSWQLQRSTCEPDQSTGVSTICAQFFSPCASCLVSMSRPGRLCEPQGGRGGAVGPT